MFESQIETKISVSGNRFGPAFFEHLKTSQMIQQKMDMKESII